MLTIDRYAQRVAERLLNQAVLDNKASGGLILVMDPHTGNILAAANNPTYNLTADQIYDPQQADHYKAKIVSTAFAGLPRVRSKCRRNGLRKPHGRMCWLRFQYTHPALR